MKNILPGLLVFAFSLSFGYTQTDPNVAHELAVGKKMTQTSAEMRPLVMVDGAMYEGSISGFRASDIEAIKILDPLSAHAIWNGKGLHGAIDIRTKQFKINECDDKLAELDPGYKSFITNHKGNNNITYRFNGAVMRGDRYNTANILYNIPPGDFKFVLTKKYTNSYGVGAIVSMRTIK